MVRFEFARKDATYEEGPREILDKKEQVLRTKIIPLVKVLWDHHGVEGEDEKQVPRTLYRFASLNFEDEIFVRGRGCNTQH